MAQLNCNCRCGCTIAAVIASAIIGVLTAFFQITAVITISPVFLWLTLGIAVVYLLGLLTTATRSQRQESESCICSVLNTLLIGILGTILFSLVLLAFGIVATSVINAILTGILLFFLSLTLTSSACYVRYLSGCER